MASRRLFDGATIEIGQVPIVAPAPPPVSGSVFWIKVAGTWREAIAHIKIAGTWREATPFIKVSGTWR